MKIRDVMETKIVEAHPWDSLRDGCELMEKHGVRHLLIRENDGTVSGIVSDRDLRLTQPSRVWRSRGEAEFGLDSMRLQVAMTEGELITVQAEADVSVAADQMLDHFVSALPVISSGEIVGIVTTSDILEVVAKRRGMSESAAAE